MSSTSSLPDTVSSWILQKSFAPLFAIYVYLLVLLPSGSLFGVNVKMLCFLLLVGPTVHFGFRNHTLTVRKIALVLLVPALLALWVLIAQLYAVDIFLSLSEYKDIWTTLASCWIAAVYCHNRESRNLSLLRLVFYAEVTASLLKLGLLAYCFIRGFPVSLMVDSINAFFKVNLMGMDFESALGRIQFTADGLIPLCLYLLLRYRARLRIGVLAATIQFVVLSLSLIFTFSRYFWAFGALTCLLGTLLSKKDKFHALLLGVLGLATIAALPTLISLYQLRTSAEVAGGSDDVRTEQIPALSRFYLDAPFFGHGLGSSTSEVLRSEETPYLYEVQLYALGGQVGLFGLALLVLITSYYFAPLWTEHRRTPEGKVSLSLILLAWLAAGLFNPMLLNSAAAMSYAAIRALAYVESDAPDPAPGLVFTRELAV